MLLASLGDSPRSAGGSDPGSFHITPSALGPGACEILSVPFKSGVYFPQPLGLQKVSPAGFQSQMSWGLVFPVQGSWAEEPEEGLRPLAPWGEPLKL